MLLVSPDDMMNFKKICKTLGKDEELPTFPIETKCMDAIMVRSIRIRSCPFLMLEGLTDNLGSSTGASKLSQENRKGRVLQQQGETPQLLAQASSRSPGGGSG